MGFLFCGNKVPMSCGECGKGYRTAARVTAGNVVEDIMLKWKRKEHLSGRKWNIERWNPMSYQVSQLIKAYLFLAYFVT